MIVFGSAELIAQITLVASGSGSVIVITTASAHGLATNDKVLITGVEGTVEANGYFSVTNLTSTTFSLQGTTFVNSYVADTGFAYKGRRLRIKCGASPTTNVVVSVSYRIASYSSHVIGDGFTVKLTNTTAVVLFTATPLASIYLDLIAAKNPDNVTQSIYLEEELHDNTVVEHQRLTGILQYERAAWRQAAGNIDDPTGASRTAMGPVGGP